MSERTDWTTELPRLLVTAHCHSTPDTVTVELRIAKGWAKKPTLTLQVPREALADPMLELGAVWTMTPGLRLPTYRERMALARERLTQAGGDIEELSDEDQQLIRDADLPY